MPRKKVHERGLGTVEYVKGRANPYRARVPVEKYTDCNGHTQTRYKSLGYFRTRKQAEISLLEFAHAPTNLSDHVTTFEELYEKWLPAYRKTLKNESAVRTITSAYQYCGKLYKMKLKDIGPGHIKDVMEEGFIIVPNGKDAGKKRYASIGTKERIKSMCNLMFDYAVERKYMLENPARLFHVNKLLKEIEDNRKVKKVFSCEQVQDLWAHKDAIPNTDIVLIALYTGFRPQEVLFLETKNIDLAEGKIVGGMKTENGRNRTVPIHPKIRPLIEERLLLEQRFFHTGMLFNDNKRPGMPKFTYDMYRHRFAEIMAHYKMTDFSPHCTRHTFATRAAECGMDKGIMKRIMGHSLKGNVTEDVYIHPTFENHMTEMLKLNYGEK